MFSLKPGEPQTDSINCCQIHLSMDTLNTYMANINIFTLKQIKCILEHPVNQSEVQINFWVTVAGAKDGTDGIISGMIL